ncbi:MAG: 16S rRNA (uracil(1498)-N(3))-methyltransferase [Polyangiaceae bacterium]|nr:16S rRNA (uracil(1498)-N(3))-methyltransferase [Polyangiaceae bacterium]
MNLILISPAELDPRSMRAVLIGRRAVHVRQVHRARVGDHLRVGMLDGAVGQGTVVELSGDRVVLEIELRATPPQDAGMHLVLALPRPKVLGRLLRDATTLGIKRLTLVNAARVEKSYWQNHRLAPEWMRDQAVLGLEQARDTLMPRIDVRRRFRPFVEDELSQAQGFKLVLHPTATEACPRASNQYLTLAVGPEGGFIPFELELLANAGFSPLTLGPRVLRVETVIGVLVGRLRG